MDLDGLPVAMEVLMFLVVTLNAAWKMPISFFLIRGLNAVVRSNFITKAINRLQAVNVRVVSLICDGPSTHLVVGAKFGASLTAENMKPVFAYPS